jgi:hypothetical protein
MEQGNAVRLHALLQRHRSVLEGNDDTRIEAALPELEAGLAGYDATTLKPGELRGEWDAMVALYRALRQGHATIQAALRSSDVAEPLTRLYYALRSIQGSLSMAYVVAGTAAERPETSPVGTAIGLFDAPKVLAQETHLRSGSYDAILPYFVRWMQEIATDMAVREADYLRFYGERDVPEAQAILGRILGLGEHGAPQLYALQPGGVDDPARRREQLARWASDTRDLVHAAHTIQEVGHEARMQLVSLLAHRARYRDQLGGEEAVQDVETALQGIVDWPFPVGETPLFDLAAEQEAFDTLLGQLPQEVASLRDPVQGWAQPIQDALRRACAVEQSLRAHRDAYRERYHDPRFRRSFRWYVWEFLTLAEQSAPTDALGARARSS